MSIAGRESRRLPKRHDGHQRDRASDPLAPARGSEELAPGLHPRFGHPHRGQLAGEQQPREQLRVAPVGLIRSPAGRGVLDGATTSIRVPARAGGALGAKARRPGLIAGVHRPR